MKTIKGKYALVTGASSGIGWDMCKELANKGANLIITARRKNKLTELKNEIAREHSIDIKIIPCDLSLPESPHKLFRQINRLKIPVDILINNAGFGIHKYVKNISLQQNQHMINLLILNLTQLTQLFLPSMLKRNKGFILNTASIAAFQANPGYAVYGAAKSYVFNFTLALRYELKNTNIKCSALCPGVIMTGFQEVAEHHNSTFFMRITQVSSVKAARMGIKAMIKGKAFIIPGLINKFNYFASRFLPRAFTTHTAFKAMGKP